jgi:uncharacterized protein (DUF58 family)
MGCGFFVPILFPVAQALTALALGLVLLDYILLFSPQVSAGARRTVPKVLSLGDENNIHIEVENLANIPLSFLVVDELPVQLQVRDFGETLKLRPMDRAEIHYPVRPVERGAYFFGDINLFLSTSIGLLQRRLRIEQEQEAPVYPSILQMKQFELKAFNRVTQQKGIKKIRRIGHSYEFEQIKNYVRGDDYRSINWKASSRKSALMVNQYEDERAQQIYSIIDKSRNMHMPFAGLSLMDYAINTSLVISNIALQKYDRAGLITFSDKIGATLKADSRSTQLNKILQALYKEEARPTEANYELLYYATRKLIAGRSLLVLYTNFESMYALDRVLPVLRRINQAHLLVVVFFENTEIREFSQAKVQTLEDIYMQTVAQKFIAEKAQMVQKLRQYGIQAVLTAPEDLSINTINKYLELKSRGLI